MGNGTEYGSVSGSTVIPGRARTQQEATTTFCYFKSWRTNEHKEHQSQVITLTIRSINLAQKGHTNEMNKAVHSCICNKKLYTIPGIPCHYYTNVLIYTRSLPLKTRHSTHTLLKQLRQSGVPKIKIPFTQFYKTILNTLTIIKYRVFNLDKLSRALWWLTAVFIFRSDYNLEVDVIDVGNR